MLRLAVDQDFNEKIVNGIHRRLPSLDAVRVSDVGLAKAEDPEILAWAAGEGRVVLTHDRKTMMRHAYERMANGFGLRGVIIAPQMLPIGLAVEELCLLIEVSAPKELESRVLVLPL